MTTAPERGRRTYWVLRVLESALLLVILVGIGLFAYSAVDIYRIETAPGAEKTTAANREVPRTAWPGIATFFGGLIALQVTRVALMRVRRPDGTPRASALYSDDDPAIRPGDDSSREREDRSGTL
ncbi:MAG: hypothetical protein Q7W30_06420 [Coriobacteriia bacterium]|nr:hypothetical protein [Coriobacteriia bacterium]